MAEAVQHDLGDRLAAELESAGSLLEELAVMLCLDPVVFERHAEPLQRFDLLTQTIREVAHILRLRGDPGDITTSVRLDAMIARLTERGEAA